MSAAQRFLVTRIVFPLFTLFGRVHGVEEGAKRYVDALVDASYETGRFYASPYPSTSGDMVDQASHFENLDSEAFQDNAYQAVQRFLPARLGMRAVS